MLLHEKLKTGEGISAPGVFDPLSALVAGSLGFEVLYMTGYGVNASLLGKPDAGFAAYREMVERVRAIKEVSSLPLIADGDTGFGGLPNVEEAVRGYEAAGAAAIQLEDQEYPKRCGHTRNRKVIPAEDMVDKIRVATSSRRDEHFLVVARTDARTEHGIDEALSRAEAYANAGADVLFIEAPESIDEMQQICDHLPETPKIANIVAGGSTPVLDDAALFEMGYRIVIHPIYLLGAAVKGMQTAGLKLREGSESDASADIAALNELVGFQHIWDLDEQYKK